MNVKMAAALAVFCFIAVMALPACDAEGDQAQPDYVSQLEEDYGSYGMGVYNEVTERFKTQIDGGSPTGTLTIPVFFQMSGNLSLFSTQEEAEAFAVQAVNTALAAIYYTDAEAIWLWDLPIAAPTVAVECRTVTVAEDGGTPTGTYYTPVKVEFTVSVPTDFAENNGISQAIADLREARIEVTGSVSEKVQAIANSLRNVRVTDDTLVLPEDASEDDRLSVSNAYDALVTGESSSAGIAMAFTYLCQYNGVVAETVKGDVVTDSDDNTETGFWNVVWDGESRWYNCDVTFYDGDDRAPLMAGVSTSILMPDGVTHRGFGAVHVADLDLSSDNSLSPTTVPAQGFQWPDDRSFLEKWGTHVMAIIIVAIIVGVILYALKKGDV